MENPILSDIFKFVSLRAAQNYDYERDVVNIIRDNRIVDTYLPDEIHTTAQDEGKFSKSVVTDFVFERIKNYLPNAGSLKAENVRIVDDVGTIFGMSEKINQQHINEFVKLINLHLVSFNKSELIGGLNEIIKKAFSQFSNIKNIKDYVEIIADADPDVSRFSADYYSLYERLYALYVCKRQYPINLEYVLDGLRALYVLLWLKLELDETEAIEGERKGCLPRILQVIPTFLKRVFQKASSPTSAKERRMPSENVRSEAAEETEPQRTLHATSIITTYNSDTSFRIRTKEDLAKVFNATPFIHPMLAYLLYYYKPFNLIKSIGIGDLKVVKQWLCAYEAGEIAHIENVLKGEVKERIHRRLDRTEDILTTETEKIEENEKHLQTANRYELQSEVDKTLQESFNINNRNNIVYKGNVDVDNTLDIAYSRSKEEANKSASNFSREIISQSVTRIQKRVREDRTLRRLFEVEETNKHGFNNEKGSGHVTGVYRFLDKRYKAQVFNYGKRMMFEFVIPEPGAFYLEAFEYLNRKSKLPSGEQEPKAPTIPTEKVEEITEATVTKYSAEYVIEGIKPFPSDIQPYSANFEIEKGNPDKGSADLPDNGTGNQNFSDTKEIQIPEGRYAEIAVSGEMNAWHKAGTDHGKMTIKLGSTERTQNTDVMDKASRNFINIGMQIYNPPAVTYMITTSGVKYFKVNFTVTVKADNAKIKAQWRQDTYDKIQTAYKAAYASYQAEKAKYENKKESLEAQYGAMTTRGKNSRINEQIIKDEMQKHSITMLAKQFDIDAADDDEIFNAMSSKEVTVGKDANNQDIKLAYPAFDIDEAKKEGRIVQFLQQAFEWQNIAYILYPYFWAREKEWFKKIGMYDENLEAPLFGAFLRAGYARILVAVRPAYEMAVLHYLYTREPWNGGPSPGLYHPLYLPIHEELREQQDDLNNAEPVGEPWEYVLPTTLVYLQQGSELPSFNCEKYLKK